MHHEDSADAWHGPQGRPPNLWRLSDLTGLAPMPAPWAAIRKRIDARECPFGRAWMTVWPCTYMIQLEAAAKRARFQGSKRRVEAKGPSEGSKRVQAKGPSEGSREQAKPRHARRDEERHAGH
eukprot:9248698-Alexandrium_andersonii.AAC.1